MNVPIMTPDKNTITSKDIASHIEAMEKVAYKRGWDDAIRAMTAAAEKLQVSSPVKEAKKPAAPKGDSGSAATDRGWLTRLVQGYIKAEPGKTRREVAEGLRSQNPDINEESVKTSIKRLVKADKVEDKDGKLY